MGLVVRGFNYKRGRKNKHKDYRNTKLFGQRFPFRRKVACSDVFIEESGIGNPDMRKAAISAIDTDYGIKIEVFEDVSVEKETVIEPKEDVIIVDEVSVTLEDKEDD
jgi:hypothetical protein